MLLGKEPEQGARELAMLHMMGGARRHLVEQHRHFNELGIQLSPLK